MTRRDGDEGFYGTRVQKSDVSPYTWLGGYQSGEGAIGGDINASIMSLELPRGSPSDRGTLRSVGMVGCTPTRKAELCRTVGAFP